MKEGFKYAVKRLPWLVFLAMAVTQAGGYAKFQDYGYWACVFIGLILA